ncbi:ATP-binding protein [Butyricicoccus sp. 1XD8-22]|nr:ATP-binding protein [Butyricicoccus sp. 1XD8-22]
MRQTVTYPSSFILIAATNPCPCGYYGSNERYCTCSPQQIHAYQQKASGPLLDRLDFFLTLKSVGIHSQSMGERSEKIRIRTTKAREIQRVRYHNQFLNGNAPAQLIQEACVLTEMQSQYLKSICYNQKWSNRTQLKIMRVARTIADLASCHVVKQEHLEEAITWKKQSVNQETIIG